MIEISDEMLNRYIDSELSASELSEFNELLEHSEEAKKRLYALQLVHKELKKFPVKETSSEFTALVMKKIIRKPERKEQKYFIFSVSSFFILISLAIIGYLTSYIVSSGTSSPENNINIKVFVPLIDNLIHGVKTIFSTGNVSIIGLIFSFGIFISAYFFFDSHKQAKAKLNKL